MHVFHRPPLYPALRLLALACACAAVLAGAMAPGARAATLLHPRIINGTSVDQARFDSQYPFLTQVYLDGAMCGGALVAPTKVLTAGHCVTGSGGSVLPTSAFSIVTGRRLANSGVDGQELTVSDVARHPLYDDDTLDNDLAVLTLSSASTATPVTVVGADEDPWWGVGAGIAGSATTGPWISGWGNTDAFGSTFPDAPEEALVPAADDATCASNLDALWADSIDPHAMWCAGVLDTDGVAGTTNGVDACQGDSGTSLVVSDGMGSWRTAGVVSWGNGCATGNFGVYTRLASYRHWLADQGVPLGAGGAGDAGDDATCVAAGAETAESALETGLAASSPANGGAAISGLVGGPTYATLRWSLPAGVTVSRVQLVPASGDEVRSQHASGSSAALSYTAIAPGAWCWSAQGNLTATGAHRATPWRRLVLTPHLWPSWASKVGVSRKYRRMSWKYSWRATGPWSLKLYAFDHGRRVAAGRWSSASGTNQTGAHTLKLHLARLPRRTTHRLNLRVVVTVAGGGTQTLNRTAKIG